MGCGNWGKQIIHGCSGLLITTAKPHIWMMALVPSPTSQRMEGKIGIIKAALSSQMSMTSWAKSSPVLWQTQLKLSNSCHLKSFALVRSFHPIFELSAVWTLPHSAPWKSKAVAECCSSPRLFQEPAILSSLFGSLCPFSWEVWWAEGDGLDNTANNSTGSREEMAVETTSAYGNSVHLMESRHLIQMVWNSQSTDSHSVW